METGAARKPQKVMVVAEDSETASALAREFAEVGCGTVAAFADSRKALQWLLDDRPDVAIIDALLADPAALRLSTSLRQMAVQVVFFASYDIDGRRLRAKSPDAPGRCRDTSIRALLEAVDEQLGAEPLAVDPLT